VAFTERDVESSLPARVERLAAASPQGLALQEGASSWSFAELDSAANRLSNALLRRLGEGEGIAGVLLEHGSAQVIALYGILKAGKAFVALSPDLPPARNAFILADGEVQAIVCDARTADLARSLAGQSCPVINLDELAGESGARPGLVIPPERLASLIYTSGSTGQPKGTMQTHRNLLHAVRLLGTALQVRPADRFAYTTPLGYIASLITTMAGPLHGASVHPFDLQTRGLGEYSRWLQDAGITICVAVPSLLRRWLEATPEPGLFPALRMVLTSGERLQPDDVTLFARRLPGCELLNIYGSSESLIVSAHRVDTSAAGGRVPVGQAVPDQEILLVDEAGQPVSPGETGEIVVKSRYLSPGYWRRPDLTAAAFAPDPSGGGVRLYRSGDVGVLHADGTLEYLGRRDGMVKVRGQRVELGEVELTLLKARGVKEAAVLARPDAHQSVCLVAYVVPTPDETLTTADLRAELGRTLPSYMVPSRFVMLPELPVNTNGKVDRQRLPDPGWRGSQLAVDIEGPRNEMERWLVALCEDVLDLRPIGIHDSLLDLGADSLSLLTLAVALEQHLGRSVSPSILLRHPTVEALARALLSEQGEAEAPLRPRETRVRRLLQLAGRVLRSPGSVWRRAADVLSSALTNHGPVLGPLVLPYAVGTRLLERASRERWLRQLLFPERMAVVARCMAGSAAFDGLDGEQVLHTSFFANLWRLWRGKAFARCTAEQRRRWIEVEGVPEQSCAGKVVFAIAHQTAAPLAVPVIKSLGITGMRVVGYQLHPASGARRAIRRSVAVRETTYFARLTNQLYEAQRALRSGGCALIAADGRQGTSVDIEVPFLGHRRPFKSGFAELALSADARVVPLSVMVAPSGRLRVRLGAPLTPIGATHAERVRSLVVQYATWLERQWVQDLGNIAWRQIALLLSDPKITEP
jgi:amino acid adenylation domain-containing protein